MSKLILGMGGAQAGWKVLILGNKCYRCGHIWQPRNIDEKPAVCPKCKNPYWDRPKKEKKQR
jgi:predicted Zn-ribbon and HTH transcriptional regulator